MTLTLCEGRCERRAGEKGRGDKTAATCTSRGVCAATAARPLATQAARAARLQNSTARFRHGCLEAEDCKQPSTKIGGEGLLRAALQRASADPARGRANSPGPRRASPCSPGGKKTGATMQKEWGLTAAARGLSGRGGHPGASGA